MNRVLLIVLGVILVILLGCGDEEQGFPNPLQIEISTKEESTKEEEEQESSPGGSITGRIIFTDDDGQIKAYALSSNEYVILEGSSKRVSGRDPIVFVDFPLNNNIQFMGNGYFLITDVGPGTHEVVLVHTADVAIAADPGTILEDNYTEINVPTRQWTVSVESDKNTTLGSLTVPIPGLVDLEWESGEVGQEVIIPQEPQKPTVPTNPLVPTRPIVSTKPLVNPENVQTGHVYLLDNVGGNVVPDDSANSNDGTINGDPQIVRGLSGNALRFDGVDDYVTIPNTEFINAGGPWPNRTVMVVFSCADVSKPEKQCIYEEGGATRGFCIYALEGQVYVGGWNRAEYNWDGSWMSAPIRSNEWHAVALVLRDTKDEVEQDKLEMWLDGVLVDKAPAGQMYGHTAAVAIGAVSGDTIFHDDVGSGTTLDYFLEGIVDEVWILNEALTTADFRIIRFGVEAMDKLASSWGTMKVQH